MPGPASVAQQLEKVFLGVPPHEHRKFISGALAHLRQKGYERVVMPCAGQFTLVKCALAAGYGAQDLETSDISLFSCILGYLATGRPVRELDFELGAEWRRPYGRLRSDVARAAFLVWLMKVSQLRSDKVYENQLRLEYLERAEHYQRELRGDLEAFVSAYGGISFAIRDLRDVLDEKRERKTVLILDPPIYSGGYDKMFDFGDALRFDSGVEEFDVAGEYGSLYAQTRRRPEPHFWYRYKEAEDFPDEEVVFAREIDAKRIDYWLCTKPKLLRGYEHLYRVVRRRPRGARPDSAPIVRRDFEITPDTQVRLVPVDAEVAVYYRDLWAHKLGKAPGCEFYFLVLLDGHVFATSGFMGARELLQLRTDRIFENFAFSAPLDRQQGGRLVRYLLTSRQFGLTVRSTITGVNRLYDLRGLRTTFLSRYRKAKVCNGILELELREKLPNGTYRLVYDAEFRDEGFAECVARFLEEGR